MQTSSSVGAVGALVVAGTEANVAALGPLIERALEYEQAARSVNTRRAYAAQWKLFSAWCSDFGLESLPADPALVSN